MSRITVTACALLLAPSLAAADELATHDFATLDRASGKTEVGVDLSFVTGDLGDADGAISRLDLHGQYMINKTFGMYGNFAVSKAFLGGSDPLSDMLADLINDATAMSNLELGGQMQYRLNPELTLVAHAGIALPTAQDDDLGALAANVLSVQRRFTDLVTAMPGFTTLRLGASPVWSRGKLFARADVGLDIVIDEPEMSSADPIAHANLAVGARTGKLSGAVELVTLATTGDVDEGEDRFLHTAALSLRYDAGRFSPSIAIVTPLDDGLGDVVTLGAGIGAAF